MNNEEFLISKGICKEDAKSIINDVTFFNFNHAFILYSGNEHYMIQHYRDFDIEDQENYFKFRNEYFKDKSKKIEIYFIGKKLRSVTEF